MLEKERFEAKNQIPEHEVERMIRNASFSVEVEGFHITQEQKDDWRKVAIGEVTPQFLMQKYLEKARRYGAGSQ